MNRPRVLMVTGVYHPETSGASLQCRQLIAHLRSEVDFEVLTTSADPALPRRDVIDGVRVFRIYVDPSRPRTKMTASISMTGVFLSVGRRADILHVHGFSQKTILLLRLARLCGLRTVMKLTSLGHDDPLTVRRKGGLTYRTYRSVDRAIAVSPALESAWREAGLDADRLTFIPNAVDPARFRPAAPGEREALKRAHGWAPDLPVVLFVGFFSHEKRPDLLYRTWTTLWASGIRSTLVLIGATRSAYYEIDASMAVRMRDDAAQRAFAPHLVFVERTADIECHYRAADVFALPTTREGLPNVLLEAMASGVPPVISRLPGVTDWIVEDGMTGRLVPPSDDEAFTRALRDMLISPEARQRMGSAARAHVEQRFAPHVTASRTLDVYMQLVGSPARP